VSDVSLAVNEIFLSLQGESTFAGLPCVFVRLAACNLRCSYCDTAYAFGSGVNKSIPEILAEIHRKAELFAPANGVQPRLPLVEITGGEPLLQKNSLALMTALCDEGLTVLCETNGAIDISAVDPRVRRIMDLKCPASGESHRNRWENLQHIRPTDEIKFVISTIEDYLWTKEQLVSRNLAALCPILISWAQPLTEGQQHGSLKPLPSGQTLLSRLELAERVIADALPVRFQVQMHKVIWPPDMKGV
jgi:7-carboxy-7-deazaguanine synthase